MKLRQLSVLLICLSNAVQLGAGPARAGEWERVGSVEGDGFAYRLFSRKNDDEVFVRFKVRGTIDAPPPALVRAFIAIVTDPTRASAGQTVRVISKDERSFVVHTRMDLPPLFSDREIVFRGESSVDAATGTNRVAWKTIDHPSAPRVDDGTIRIEHAAGAWVFVPSGDRSSDVTYENYLDLGGSLPPWLLRRLMGGTVGKSFEDMAAEALGRGPKHSAASPQTSDSLPMRSRKPGS